MKKNIEREIAKALQQGNRQAWLQLYEAYAEEVWRNVSRLVGYDSAIVADIVQETFLAAARSVRGFKPHRGSLWMWLWTIAKRQVALYYRKQKPNIALSQAQHWWNALDGEKSDWIDVRADMPSDILQSQELAALVRCALSELPHDYQTLLLAKYVDNQPIEQIAKQINFSESAVRSKLARARKAFRKTFKKISRTSSGSREVLL
ncbi:MAG: RNA polymerase sigma factor [Planctomycetota bacterium]|jgi:RNA polymerase sigma-70 factor (ECF subfamily)